MGANHRGFFASERQKPNAVILWHPMLLRGKLSSACSASFPSPALPPCTYTSCLCCFAGRATARDEPSDPKHSRCRNQRFCLKSPDSRPENGSVLEPAAGIVLPSIKPSPAKANKMQGTGYGLLPAAGEMPAPFVARSGRETPPDPTSRPLQIQVWSRFCPPHKVSSPRCTHQQPPMQPPGCDLQHERHKRHS